MSPYWYISGFIALLSILEVITKGNNNSQKISTYLFLICVLVLIVFGGIRGLGTGMDDYQYRSFYHDFLQRIEVNGVWQTIAFFRYEPLTFVIAFIASVVSKNSDILIFIYCAISVSINAAFFKKLSPYPILTLALYSAHIFINKDMNQIRFGLSSAFFLGFVYFLFTGEKMWAFAFFLLSFFSHNTAVIAVTIIPFLFIRKSPFIPIMIILVSVPLSKVGGNNFVQLISSHLGGLGQRAADYSNGDSTEPTSVFSIANFKNIILVFVFCYFMLSRKLKETDWQAYSFNYLIILIFSIGGAVRIFFYDYPSGARLSNYLLQVEPIVLATLVFYAKKVLKLPVYMMVLLIVAYYLYYNTIQVKQAVVGYTVSDTFRLTN